MLMHPLSQLAANTLLWAVAALFVVVMTACSRAKARRAALQPAPQASGTSCTAREKADEIIAGLREQIGLAQTDLDLALEAPGLFDIRFAASKEFWKAMTKWQDSSLRITGVEAVIQAQTLQALWEDTVAQARVTGDAYLASDDRINLKTARGLAAKAASTGSSHEREALMAKVAEILVKLNLAFLGREAIASITTVPVGSIEASSSLVA